MKQKIENIVKGIKIYSTQLLRTVDKKGKFLFRFLRISKYHADQGANYSFTSYQSFN